ncbi:MAG: hypothetical protein C0608_11250 [Deltaproteobacteria bacterium]|nr:MAG: hypothetical protein C0608_11250 [Deltaproteobacteria bacterium]
MMWLYKTASIFGGSSFIKVFPAEIPMSKITIMPIGKEIEVAEGENLLSAVRRAGAAIQSPCNGEGSCGKCLVRVEGDKAPETPHKNLSRKKSEEGWRLACRVAPDLDMTIHLAEDFSLDARILEGDRISGIPLTPAPKVTQEGGRFKLSYGKEPERVVLTDWEEGYSPKGLAIDIGTTTLVATLFSLETGDELGTASAINPQVDFGHDVLTRIQKGSTPEGLAELMDVLSKGFEKMIEELLSESGAKRGEILDVVIGGNTTMLQIAGGFDPAPLGRFPFTVGISGGQTYPATRFGLKLNSLARVYIPPVAHAFVGSDITVGLIATNFFHRDGNILFVDIGTNGEMGLSTAGKKLVTSAAAGPAFEGMGIAAGMRAAKGAIEEVSAKGGELSIKVIGGGEAKGICGSGIIDATAALLSLGVIDATGKMRAPEEAEDVAPKVRDRLEVIEGKPVFRLAEGVYFTQNDVRQIQLAKSAVRTAIESMLSEGGVRPEELDALILAGAFGYHLKPESLETIGLIPSGLIKRITFAGNTSRTGSAMLLLDLNLRAELEEKMSTVKHIGLAEGKEFQKRFIEHIGFTDLTAGKES